METIIVTGGRDFQDHNLVTKVLNALSPRKIIVGDCPTGVDLYTTWWARDYIQEYVVYEALWDKEGKAAGPFRNARMIKDHPDATVIAFPGGKGTKNCVNQALEAGLIVLKLVTNREETMKSLDESNAERRELQYRLNDPSPVKNGIACPECKKELWDSNPMVTLTSMPAQKNIHCDCGYRGYRIA